MLVKMGRVRSGELSDTYLMSSSSSSEDEKERKRQLQEAVSGVDLPSISSTKRQKWSIVCYVHNYTYSVHYLFSVHYFLKAQKKLLSDGIFS